PNRASTEPRNVSSTEAQSAALARDRQSARRTGSNSPVLTASREPTVLAAPAAERPRDAAPSSSSVPAVPRLQSSPTKTRNAAALPAAVSDFTPEPESAPRHDLALW